MTNELKPCQCGKAPGIDRWVSGYDSRMQRYRVECQCGICGPWDYDRERAIAAWNALPRAACGTTYDGMPETLPGDERVYLVGHQSTGRLSRDWATPCWWVDVEHDFRPLKIGDEWTLLPEFHNE